MAETSRFFSLYRQLIRESGKFSSYNFRNYFLRRVRDNFHSQLVTGHPPSNEFFVKAEDMLALIKRQAAISNMYAAPKMVLEKDAPSTAPSPAT